MRTRHIAIALVAACAYSTGVAATFGEIKAAYTPSDTLILDRQGAVLHRLRTNPTVRKGQWVALADVSPALRTALVLSEDKRFYAHSGVDWRAVSAAAWGNLWNTKTRGASTLTMQLAGLLDEDLKRNSGGRSVVQKLGQAVSAQWLERDWRKDQILEAYLNLVPLKGELVGIDAVSQTLFGKAAHALDNREAAVTAALVRAPNAKAAQVTQRACAVLQSLEAHADCEALDLFVSGALQRKAFDTSEGIAPHWARYVVRETQRAAQLPSASPGSTQPAELPASIRTTVHAPLQRFAVQTLQTHLRELRQRHVEDAALVVLDNASGEVLAWVGSSGELSGAPDVDLVTALRQPGSTLKPFLYGQAIAERRITAASLLEDSGTQIQTASGLYIPQNYDHQFKGWVSARTALAASLNVPAVRTLFMVSPDSFHKQLVRLGLPLKESGDFYGYSLALGSAEVPLLHLANAYRALAQQGRLSPIRWRAGDRTAPSTSQALDAGAAFIVGDILSDPLARARTFGTDSVLSTRYWSAVKTGTSKDMRDNWALGYSARYTVGVWVGNASGAPMWDVSGTTGAAPLWAAVMNYLHKTQSSRAPQAPAGVAQVPVKFNATASSSSLATAAEAPRQEWFMNGTQQTTFTTDLIATRALSMGASGQKDPGFPSNASKQATAGTGRITAPTTGTIIALDPDIPPKNQRLTFTAEGSQLRWQMDGKVFAKGNTAQWLPWPGRHVVRIVNSKDDVLDEVKLEVRGAGVK
ncbi:penicillin-binding protein 1C [Rhodoferax aquaticus]|uniref:penicillin-binding protein 1C n=1 Tax=Rhodoferax aquaticus TaxID=2527691 RepID=UPI001F0202CF|nr:penicillin-binding protein 1C [Rhodoferax aquaticus]